MQSTIDEDVSKLIKAGKLAGEKAREENFSLGLPVHIVENGMLVSVDKTGKKIIVKALDRNFTNA